MGEVNTVKRTVKSHSDTLKQHSETLQKLDITVNELVLDNMVNDGTVAGLWWPTMFLTKRMNMFFGKQKV